MKILVHFLGIMAKYTGVEAAYFDVPEKPVLGDLLKEVDKLYGDHFPFEIWDKRRKRVSPTLFIAGKGHDLKTLQDPLFENEEIYFLLPLSGG